MVRYDPRANQWFSAPDMIIARMGSSGCTLADSIYVFCGYNGARVIESIEVLDVALHFYRRTAKWNLVTPVTESLTACSCPAVAKFSDTQIIILGGSGGAEKLVQTFDIQSNTVTKKEVSSEECWSPIN